MACHKLCKQGRDDIKPRSQGPSKNQKKGPGIHFCACAYLVCKAHVKLCMGNDSLYMSCGYQL